MPSPARTAILYALLLIAILLPLVFIGLGDV